LQGHFTQINAKTLQMLRNNHTIARTVTSLEAAGRSEETVHLVLAELCISVVNRLIYVILAG